jgi:hypothetical protein
MQQGRVVVRMRVLLLRNGLLKLGHNHAKGIPLLEPMGKQMHAHKRQTGPHLDHLYATGHTARALGVTRAAFVPIEPPLRPPPVEVAQTHRNGDVLPHGLVEQHLAWARRVLLQQGPQEGLLNFAKLAPSTKGWTCILIEGTLTQGELHDVILLHT